MTTTHFIVSAFLGWLLGIGVLAYGVAHALTDDDAPGFVKLVVEYASERVAVAMAFVIVGWPLVLPVIMVRSWRREKDG